MLLLRTTGPNIMVHTSLELLSASGYIQFYFLIHNRIMQCIHLFTWRKIPHITQHYSFKENLVPSSCSSLSHPLMTCWSYPQTLTTILLSAQPPQPWKLHQSWEHCHEFHNNRIYNSAFCCPCYIISCWYCFLEPPDGPHCFPLMPFSFCNWSCNLNEFPDNVSINLFLSYFSSRSSLIMNSLINVSINHVNSLIMIYFYRSSYHCLVPLLFFSLQFRFPPYLFLQPP